VDGNVDGGGGRREGGAEEDVGGDIIGKGK